MKLYRFTLPLAACLFATFLLPAQTATTSLHGTITDQTGAVVPGVRVMIANPDTGAKAERVTDTHGDYDFEQIAPGKYNIVAQATGFAVQKQVAELLVNQAGRVDFKLGIEHSAETVEVIDEATALNTTDATIGTPFDTHQIQSLPFEGNNVLDLLSLQAGVLFLGDQTQEQMNSDSRSGAVDGARSDQSNVTLDGLDDNDQNEGYAFSGVLRSTRDSVEEFRVVTTNSNADSGRSSGAQVSLVTRSGTNAYHGSVYEYYRPTNTVANNWFNKQAEIESGLPNIPPKLLRNTFGGSFGAPIKKDKLFYFVAYEGQHTAEDAQVTQEVPTPSLLAGNVIYSTDSCASLNPPASCVNNQVTLNPANIASMDPNCAGLGTCPLGPGVNPAAEAYYAKLPPLNGYQEGDTVNLASFTFASPNPINLNTLIAKIDYVPSDKHRFFVRGNLQDDHTTAPIQFPGQPAEYTLVDNSKGIAAGDVWTISPTIVNNLRYGLVRQGYANRGATNGPYVSFQGISTLAPTGFTSSVVSVPTHNIVDDLTWIKGKHTLQFGANYRLVLNNRSSDATLYPHAGVTYELLGYGAIAGTGSSLDPDAFGFPQVASISAYDIAIADAVGMITSAEEYYNNSYSNGQLTPLPPNEWVTHHYMTNELEYYGQDSWKLKPNLTLTIGLRHTLLQVPFERNGQEVVPTVNMGKWLDNRWQGASKGNVVQPEFGFTQGGRANHAPGFWSMDKLDLAPRFAISYQPNDKLTLRAGAGIYYDHFGQGIVDSFDQAGEFGLVTGDQAPVGAADADSAPRFSSETTVPTSIIPPITVTGPTPVIPGDDLALAWGVDQSLTSPYSYAINAGYQLQLRKGLMLEETYTGRLGRHLLQMRDVATPSDLADPLSGTDYFTAERELDQMNDQSIPVNNVKPIAYWEDMFPWLVGVGGMSATQNVYNTYFQNNPGPEAGFRGNEASALFVLDVPGAFGGGCSAPTPSGCFRYFDPQYSSLYDWSSMGTSSYNGLQFALHQQETHGVQFDLYYTLSKSIDLGSDAERTGANASGFGGFFSQIINVYNPKGNRGPSDYDVRSAVTVNSIGALPFGRGRLIGGNDNKLTDFFIGGWNVTGLMHWTSGLPFSSIDGLGWNTDWADQSWNVATSAIRSGGHQHDSLGQPNAFKNQNEAINNVRPPYASETGERNFYRGDGYFSIDNGVAKNFAITERQQVKFAAEAFNVTNSVRFDPASISNDPYFGPQTYGQYSALLTQGRRMQFSLRYSF
ncbi:MAG TPA: TonB-dependent receptor [Terracidiphilus sp.]|nr:TonB-dependent receptor [Terracidiphilus sp.]